MMFCFCCERILLASAYYIEKKKNFESGALSFKKTYQGVKNSWITHLKSTKTIIETSWEYFSILTMIRNIKWVFTLLTFWFCKNCKVLCDSRHNFSNTTYAASRNSSCFSTKIYIWTCWDVGVDIPSLFWPQQLPWQSSSNSYINKTYWAFGDETTQQRNNWMWCNTSVVWQRLKRWKWWTCWA